MIKKILALVVTISLGATGCSLLEGPDGADQGVIVLELYDAGGNSAAPALDEAFARALPTADSVVVKVYRPGTGRVPEVSRGVAISPPASTTQIELTVIAETGKRVAVELFQAGLMTFFGVDENVNVAKGQNTSVSIIARTFVLPGMWRDVALVDESTTFNLMWNRTPGAGFYRLQESSTPDFAVISFETVVVDTFVRINNGDLPGGDYYFRVAAENIYTQSEFAQHFVHVYAAPVISGISAPEVVRGQTVQVTVFGDHLNYPGTQVTIFGQTANILSAATDQLLVDLQVPAKAISDMVTVSNGLGTEVSTDFVRVQTIAYMTDVLGQGDTATAALFEQEIESYWQTIGYGAVRVMGKSFVLSPALFDVIIIGWDTASDASGWQGIYQPQADAIQNSGAMILGIGAGGASYFESIGLNIGLSKTQRRTQREVYVLDPSADIYNKPNPLNASPGSVLNVYTAPLELLGVPFSTNFTPYATVAPAMLVHPLVEEIDIIGAGTSSVNFLWGFNGANVSPDNLTPNGAWLLENVVVYLLGQGSGAIALPASGH
ncbi:MAG: hypothetical protein V3V49_04945 [Candidatus Krumholzibacteria bacterium]